MRQWTREPVITDVPHTPPVARSRQGTTRIEEEGIEGCRSMELSKSNIVGVCDNNCTA